MDELERRFDLEERFNVELRPSGMPGFYYLYLGNSQKVIPGFPPAVKLVHLEELIPWLDEHRKGWREC